MSEAPTPRRASTTGYERLLRPPLFRLSAERSHDLARRALERGLVPARRSGRTHPELATSLGDIDLASPVGLAPGFDKDATMVRSLARLGFGYVVVGSVTMQPRTGNPRPRLGRDVGRRALVNSLGLPNQGVHAVADRLASLGRQPVPVLGSIVAFSPDEAPAMIRLLERHVAAVEIGLVCPNTRSAQMQELEAFSRLAELVSRASDVPIHVKLPPAHRPDEEAFVVSAVDACIAHGIAGVSVFGGHREAVASIAGGEASVSGAPTYEDTIRNLRLVKQHALDVLTIRASGGVFNGEDAAAFLEAGADAVELYTALVYRGPNVGRAVGSELAASLRGRGMTSVRELGGGSS